MIVNIAKEDLFHLRHVLSEAVWQMENCKNPSAHGAAPVVCRKMNRKLNRALKKAFGKHYSTHGIHC